MEGVTLHAQKGGLPGKVVSFYIVPLPACRRAGAGLAGHLPAKGSLRIDEFEEGDDGRRRGLR